MALNLHIPPCVLRPPHPLHPPPANKPLRIRIQGPLESIMKLLPDVAWHPILPFPQPGGLELAKLTHQKLYGQRGEAQYTPVVRDEYLAWVVEGRRALDPFGSIDYYGLTFDHLDHLVSLSDEDPEVLAINIIDVDNDGVYGDGGKYANEVLRFPVDPSDYTGKQVLAVPRCCQHKKGTLDRELLNTMVAERDGRICGTAQT